MGLGGGRRWGALMSPRSRPPARPPCGGARVGASTILALRPADLERGRGPESPSRFLSPARGPSARPRAKGG